MKTPVILWVLMVFWFMVMVGCKSSPQQQTQQTTPPPQEKTPDPKEVNIVSDFQIESSAFGEGEMIPVKYTCDGENVSPPLTWSDPPASTKSLALINDDPDAPAGTWVHWVLWGLSPEVRELPEGATIGQAGQNDFRKSEYGGPCPPQGNPHRYYFKLYALDAEIALSSEATKQQLLEAMKGHILAETQLMGKYQRQ